MKLNIQKISISLVFCLIFILSFKCDIYAESVQVIINNQRGSMTVNNDHNYTLADGVSKLPNTETVLDNTFVDIAPWYTAIANHYCDKFQKCEENKFEDKDGIIEDIVFSYGGKEDKSPITQKGIGSILTTTTQDQVEKYGKERITIKFNTSENNVETLTAFTENMYGDRYYDHKVIDGEVHCTLEKRVFSKDEVDSVISCRKCNKRTTVYEENDISKDDIESYKLEAKIARDTYAILEELSLSAKTGLIAGSVGSGYNVGVVYSQKQVALDNIMEKVTKSNGEEYYDFMSFSGLSTSFDYYMHPLLGKCDFIADNIDFNALDLEGKITEEQKKLKRYIPSTIKEWNYYVDTKEITFISGNGILLNPDFESFSSSLSDTEINENGYKKTTKIKFSNGVTKVTDVGKSKTPNSVINYTMRIAYPYGFKKSGNNYKLNSLTLKLEPKYRLCIANGCVYDGIEGTLSGDGVVTSIQDIGIERDQLFLFNQMDETGFPKGVILIGEFDECVIDTSSSQEQDNLLFATGRKIGFANGYSELLKLDTKNVNLMFTKNFNESGKKAFLPKNVAFPCTSEEIKIMDDNQALHIEGVSREDLAYTPLPPVDNDSLIEELKNKEAHVSMENPSSYIKFNIMLTQIVNKSGVDDASEKDENGTVETLDSAKIEEMGLSKWAFVVIRNNRYIDDPELKSWLRTDSANAITYVDAEGLLAKIEGSFIDDLEKITYDEWQKMKDIENELTYNKDMWLVRVINVVALCFGSFLIIFAVLICLAYWFDIFNTFTDFSLLQFISFGNLYPIEDKDDIPYTGAENGSVKYVTFMNVLLIAFICCVCGILFINLNFIIGKILFIYSYILELLGGV